MISNKKNYFLYVIFLLICIANSSICLSSEVDGKAWLKKKENNEIIGIRLNIAKDTYLYHTDLGDVNAIGTPLKISLTPDTFKIKEFTTSTPKTKTKELFAKLGTTYKVNIHEDTMYIYLIIEDDKLPNSNSLAEYLNNNELKVNLTGQLCNKQRCLQLSLSLPVKNSINSSEAAKAFALMPSISKFSKPLPEWSNFNNKQIQNTTLKFSNNFNSSTGLKQLNSPAKQVTPFDKSVSLLDIAENELKNTNTEEPLPKFNVRKDSTEYSFFAWIGIAFLAGILLNFMPCVLPVISLKVIGFVNQAHESRKRLILLSLCFSAGIILVFLVLALAAAGFGMQWGEQFQSETFNIILACLVFAFALSFLGVFEFSAPAFAGKLQNGKSLPREGYLGAFLTGIVATLMATPCSGPFLGATISWALTQQAITVITIFLFIGLGMALPYFLLSLSKRLRNLLPKPGPWMITFRIIMGFVLLLTVIYLMIFIRSENLVATCALMVFIAFSCWIYGRYASIIHKKQTRWLARISALAIMCIGIYLSFNILKPFASKTNTTGQITQATQTSQENLEAKNIRPFDFNSFKKSLSSGKNILVDFTADWCPNCQYNTHYVFASSAVQNKLKSKDVIFYEADLTDDTPQTKKIRSFLKSLGGSAIPYAGIFPANTPEAPYVLPDILSVSKVVNILDKLPDTKSY